MTLLITALECKEEAQITSSYIKSIFIDEFNRRNEGAENQDSTAKAFKANEKYNSKLNKYCTVCKMRSHNTQDCWHNKNKTSNTQQNQHIKHNKKHYSTSLAF